MFIKTQNKVESSLQELRTIDNRLILLINTHYVGVRINNEQNMEYQPLNHLVSLLIGSGQIELPGLNSIGML